MRCTALVALLAVVCWCTPTAHARTLLDSTASPSPATPSTPAGLKCVYGSMGEVLSVDTAPESLESYIVSAYNGTGRDSMVKLLSEQLGNQNFDIEHVMSVVPAFSAKMTRLALQQLCQNSQLRSYLAGIETDEAVMTF